MANYTGRGSVKACGETHAYCGVCAPGVAARVSAGKKRQLALLSDDERYTMGRRANSGRWVNHNRQMRLHGYGLTVGDYEALLEQQHGVCAICHQPETQRSRWGGIKSLAVDHDHETNKVRGLLCNRCNSVLGWSNNDPDLLVAAILYLEASSG